jgi:hypothetical protein
LFVLIFFQGGIQRPGKILEYAPDLYVSSRTSS